MPKPARSPAAARWTLADVILIDEVADLLNRTPSLGHVILDEAQDLSPMMLRAVGRRASTGSVTVLGDLAQATTPWATRSWSESLGHLGQPDAAVTELVAGLPGARCGDRLRGSAAAAHRSRPDPAALGPATPRRAAAAVGAGPGCRPGRRGPDRAGGRGNDRGDRARRARSRRLASLLTSAGIAYEVLGEAAPSFEARVDLVPATLAKGLEFDHVVLLEPAAIVAGEPDEVTGLRRLYVCLTRAVTSLVVVHSSPLPARPRLTRNCSTAAFHSSGWLTRHPVGRVLQHHQHRTRNGLGGPLDR